MPCILHSTCSQILFHALLWYINKKCLQFETWVTANRASIGEGSYNTGMNGARNARNNLQWSNGRVGELAEYFETGYNEEEITDGAEESEEEVDVEEEIDVEEEVDGDNGTDSANIAVLSVVTLLITVGINFMV